MIHPEPSFISENGRHEHRQGTISQLLRSNGQDAHAEQAQQDLPDQVDTDQHAGLLAKFGLNPADLIAEFTGGGGGGLGGIHGELL